MNQQSFWAPIGSIGELLRGDHKPSCCGKINVRWFAPTEPEAA